MKLCTVEPVLGDPLFGQREVVGNEYAMLLS